jgi:hypothetical protein
MNQEIIDKLGNVPFGVAMWNQGIAIVDTSHNTDSIILGTLNPSISGYRRRDNDEYYESDEEYPYRRRGYYNRTPRDNVVVVPVVYNEYTEGPSPSNCGSSMVNVPWGDEDTESDAEKIREAQYIIDKLSPAAPAAPVAPATSAASAYRRYRR